MTPQEFAQKMETAMAFTPELVSRDGSSPTGYSAVVRGNEVTVCWEREVDAFGEHYEYSAKIKVEKTDTGWQFRQAGVWSEWPEYRCWFPGWCRQATAGQEFNPQKLIDFYLCSEIAEAEAFDWSLV